MYFAVKVFLSFCRVVHNSCHCNKPTDCQVLVCKSFFFHLLYLCWNLQAIIIIVKLSFWINKPFLPAVTESLDQYKEKGYDQKLKINITPDLIHSDHEDLVTLLYRQVTHTIDGRQFSLCLVYYTYEQFTAGWNTQHNILVIYYWLHCLCIEFIFICT